MATIQTKSGLDELLSYLKLPYMHESQIPPAQPEA